MRNGLRLAGRFAGIAGVLITFLAGGLRLRGTYRLSGFEAGTLMDAGVAVMVFACLCYVASSAERQG